MSELKKGVVLEISPGKVSVLTPQGEFISIPWIQKRFPAIGDEIVINVTPQRSFFTRRALLPLAASLLLFFLSIPLWWSFILPGAGQIVAYVSVDINPSIELGLNQQGRVVTAAGLNEDGVRLLEKLDLIKLAAEQAIELITAQAVLENYISPDKENTVVITVSGGDRIPEKAKKLDNSVKKALEEKKITGSAQVLEVPADFRDSARSLGVSQGKYVIYMEAVEQGLDVSLDDLKEGNIVKAVKEAGGIPGQIISKAQHDRKELKDIEKRIEDNKKKIEENKKRIEEQKDQKEDQKEPSPPGKNEGPGSEAGDGKGQENRGGKSQENTINPPKSSQGDLPGKGEPAIGSGNTNSRGKQSEQQVPRGIEGKDIKENVKNQQEQKEKLKNFFPGLKKGLLQNSDILFPRLRGFLEGDFPGGRK